MLNRRQVVVSVLVMGLFLMVGQAQGAFVATGTNTVLDNNGGDLYVPLTPATSGVLGVGGVGLSTETVILRNSNTPMTGYVSFLIEFDLTDPNNGLGPNQTVQENGASLLLQFDDLDFVPTHPSSGRTFWETMKIEFLANASDTPTGNGLTLDENTYGDYADGGAVATNDESVWYTINMKTNAQNPGLGVTSSQFAAISSDREFALWVTISAINEYSGSPKKIGNSPEHIGNSFNATGVPEPASMAMLAIGGIGVLIRRRKK